MLRVEVSPESYRTGRYSIATEASLKGVEWEVRPLAQLGQLFELLLYFRQ